MMDTPARLLERLEAIGQSLAKTGSALALIGLGSVGQELERLDAYSDLDFFVIVQPGAKKAFLDDLSWLSAPCPIAFSFLNTADGYKALYEDGIFVEMAVFEPEELEHIPFAPGRLVWGAEGVDESISIPRYPSLPPEVQTQTWLIGEALTNLYVGLGRYRRGEKLTAMRFVQEYAVDRMLELAPLLEEEQPAFPDPFERVRRFEARHPRLAAQLPHWMQGYERTPESAQAILQFLEENFGVPTLIKEKILALIQEG